MNQAVKSEILASVGQILRTEGYRALTPRYVLRVAGHTGQRGLINKLFGSFDDLLMAYLYQTDFWLNLQSTVHQTPPLEDPEAMKTYIKEILYGQLRFFRQSIAMQELLLFSLSKPRSSLKKRFSQLREQQSAALLGAADRLFTQSDIRFRPLASLLVCAIYILVLHGRNNASTFCGLNLGSEQGWQEIERAIDWLVDRV